MMDKPLSYYLKKAETLTSSNQNQFKKIAILSNFTLRGLSEILKVISNEQKMEIQVYEAPYNQFKQETINAHSGWYNFKPDLSFIILDFDSLIGDMKFQFYSMNEIDRNEIIKKTSQEFRDVLKTSVENQHAKIIISNFPEPTYSPLGIFDSKINYSMRDFVNSLNSVIRDLALENDNLFIFELDVFFQNFGKLKITDEKLRYIADMKISPSSLPMLGETMMRFIKPLFGRTKKCLVLDLDNTLWGGIIGEDGINDIKLDNKAPGNSYLEFQKVILELYNRGIILAINSSNNLEDVKEVFGNHPYMILKEHHFASICINWDDKASNLVHIAKELNIGTESLVYFDDDPKNRELVKQKLPEVLVIDVPTDSSLYANALRNLDDFNTFQITQEDFEKGKMYASQQQRRDIEKQFSNINDFLATLNMEVMVKKADGFTLPRISQIIMKTNQFNLTTKRYSEEHLKNMMNDSNFLIKTFSVNDKFGDNGLTGLYIVKKETPKKWFIDTFLMSCRIMGRNIEQVMLSDLIDEARSAHVEELIGEYIPTRKNEVTKDLYSSFGFSKINETQFRLQNLSNFTNHMVSYIRKTANN